MELNSDLFMPLFYDNTFKPITNTIIFQIMIAKYFYVVSNLKIFLVELVRF